MKRAARGEETGAIELVEEAFHLLRSAPANVLALYGIGSLPFAMAFLLFWADMSRGAFAREHAGSAGLGLAFVFLWMKCWQAVFADELRARVSGQKPAPWTARRIGRLAWTQTALQPYGLFAVPASILVVLPLGWICNFFQNVTVLGDGSRTLRDTFKVAAGQASVRQGQNLLALGIFSLFTLIVWVNVMAFMAMLPELLKTLLGIDTVFTRAGSLSIFNTTYLACSFALTYLFVDPLLKAIYVLRCFYGQSIRSGEDLKAELSRAQISASRAPAIMTILALCLACGSLSGAQTDPPPPASPAMPSQLNHAIDQVLKERQFAWRMPREKPNESDATQRNWFTRMLHDGVQAIADGLKWLGRSLAQTARWIGQAIRKLWPESGPEESEPTGWSTGWVTSLRALLIALIALTTGILTFLIIRMWRRRLRTPLVTAAAVAAQPNLDDENIRADQLPEESWLAMAREQMALGNLRLALRAFYLASLAHLAARELISVAISKSNREYENELHRRGRAYPETLNAFSLNVAAFDRAWYGLHDVTTDGLQEFQANLDRIRAC